MNRRGSPIVPQHVCLKRMPPAQGAVLHVPTRGPLHLLAPVARSQEVTQRAVVSAGGSATTCRWDEDVQVEMLTEQVTELGPFDQPYAVVPGEPSAVVTEP
jgi:hypothetical protein